MTRDHGELPAWSTAELDPPPPFSFKNALKVIGPGAIMAATSIGGGEWLVGPGGGREVRHAALPDRDGRDRAAGDLQPRGDPLHALHGRADPGRDHAPQARARASGPAFYAVLGFLQLGWPALAGSAAATLFGAWMARMPGAADHGTQAWIATGLILAVVLILSFGGTIERMLEYFAWIMLGVVFLFLLVVNVAFVPLVALGGHLPGLLPLHRACRTRSTGA